ncbi:amino acid ABC transporter permease [Solicola gregarius]|uniref:Amino acid ABC transporter permease n=1 Tax=Solicola gregarius TaxID=2908642 RepID=A0AA46TIZ7_9ACTN|nr:amino acid ABC transporter permease [Solicola gregarius]UYM05749.1 amino acid ABC transporter permease [Solicola gregarius]
MAETATAEPKPRLSPRKRAQRIRIAQYVGLVVVLLVAAFAANWDQIVDVFFNPDDIKMTFEQGLWDALVKTIEYSLGGFVLGLAGGTLLALMRLSSVGPYRWIATAYIEFFRGLPTLIVFMVLSLLPIAFDGLTVPFDPFGVVWLSLGIVGTAYMAETIRGGIEAVPRGQTEAARTLGMTSAQATRKIVLPQAFRTMLPPLTNELILLVKDSSLVYVIGFSAANYDLTKLGRELANTTLNLTPLIVAGVAYLIITLPLSYLVRRLEARTGGANVRRFDH